MKEYRIIYDSSNVDIEAELNALAGEGWRLAFVIPGHFKGEEVGWMNAQFIMERDKPNETPKGQPCH